MSAEAETPNEKTSEEQVVLQQAASTTTNTNTKENAIQVLDQLVNKIQEQIDIAGEHDASPNQNNFCIMEDKSQSIIEEDDDDDDDEIVLAEQTMDLDEKSDVVVESTDQQVEERIDSQ